MLWKLLVDSFQADSDFYFLFIYLFIFCIKFLKAGNFSQRFKKQTTGFTTHEEVKDVTLKTIK